MSPGANFLGRPLATDFGQAIPLSHLAFDLLVLGYLDQAAARRNQALLLARKTNHPYVLAVALALASFVDRLRDLEATALECLTELASLSRQQRFPAFSRLAELGFARILCAR